MPPSWKLEVEKFEDPGGVLIGRSDAHGKRLRELQQLFLVDVSDNQAAPHGDARTDFHPPSFSGSVTIAGEDDRHTLRRLKAENFRLIEAASCPAPPPPEH